MQEQQREIEEVKMRLEGKEDEYEMIDKEYKKLQEKHRETLN